MSDRFILQNWSKPSSAPVSESQSELASVLEDFPQVQLVEVGPGTAIIEIDGRNASEIARIRSRLEDTLHDWKVYGQSTYGLP